VADDLVALAEAVREPAPAARRAAQPGPGTSSAARRRNHLRLVR
jgi:hypothetical protein